MTVVCILLCLSELRDFGLVSVTVLLELKTSAFLLWRGLYKKIHFSLFLENFIHKYNVLWSHLSPTRTPTPARPSLVTNPSQMYAFFLSKFHWVQNPISAAHVCPAAWETSQDPHGWIKLTLCIQTAIYCKYLLVRLRPPALPFLDCLVHADNGITVASSIYDDGLQSLLYIWSISSATWQYYHDGHFLNNSISAQSEVYLYGRYFLPFTSFWPRWRNCFFWLHNLLRNHLCLWEWTHLRICCPHTNFIKWRVSHHKQILKEIAQFSFLVVSGTWQFTEWPATSVCTCVVSRSYLQFCYYSD